MIKMKIYKLNTKLNEPISISFHTWYFSENILVELEYKGITGIGEGAPFKPITGDSQEESIAEAKSLKEIPLNPEIDGLEKLHAYLTGRNITSHTLRAAIDFAYHDLLGKITSRPVWNIYSEKPGLIDNSVTVFIKDSVEKTKEETKKIFFKYPNLKLLKIKLKGKGDLERIKAIKGASPAGISYILDANQAYENEIEGVKVLNSLIDVLEEVVVIEQPCPKQDLLKMKFFKENTNSLIFADESAATVEDARLVVESNCAHGVNVKLQKAGGIWPAKQIAKMCVDAGLKVMVGCMLEGLVGITAGVHFAVSTSNVILTDLDMDLDSPKFVLGGSEFMDGRRLVSDFVGLGVGLDLNKITDLKKTGWMVFEEIK